jgi:hypothetical protein
MAESKNIEDIKFEIKIKGKPINVKYSQLVKYIIWVVSLFVGGDYFYNKINRNTEDITVLKTRTVDMQRGIVDVGTKVSVHTRQLDAVISLLKSRPPWH